MKKKMVFLIIVMLSVIIAVPVFSTFAVKPKPKILINMVLPIVDLSPGTTEIHGDKINFRDTEWQEGGDGASILIFQWLPNPDPGPTHIPAPSVNPGWPLTHAYEEGEIYATAHGTHDVYTFTGTWHMEFVVTFDIDGVDSGFQFKHTCEGVGLAHASTWSGSGFGAFEGIKVSGVSIADIYQAVITQTPVTKILWGEVSSGYDNIPARNVPPLS